jgi:hypothetical protein
VTSRLWPALGVAAVCAGAVFGAQCAATKEKPPRKPSVTTCYPLKQGGKVCNGEAFDIECAELFDGGHALVWRDRQGVDVRLRSAPARCAEWNL